MWKSKNYVNPITAADIDLNMLHTDLQVFRMQLQKKKNWNIAKSFKWMYSRNNKTETHLCIET